MSHREIRAQPLRLSAKWVSDSVNSLVGSFVRATLVCSCSCRAGLDVVVAKLPLSARRFLRAGGEFFPLRRKKPRFSQPEGFGVYLGLAREDDPKRWGLFAQFRAYSAASGAAAIDRRRRRRHRRQKASQLKLLATEGGDY